MWLITLLGWALAIGAIVWLYLVSSRKEPSAEFLALASELEEELEGYPYIVLTRGELILVYYTLSGELVEVIGSEEELFTFLAKEKEHGKDTRIPQEEGR